VIPAGIKSNLLSTPPLCGTMIATVSRWTDVSMWLDWNFIQTITLLEVQLMVIGMLLIGFLDFLLCPACDFLS
jgi:hypothetical protein